MLLSADLKTDVAVAAADGLVQLGDRIETFLDAQELLNTRVPFIVQVQQEGDDVKNLAPTIGDLFSVDVDFDGNDEITGDEVELQELDTNTFGNSDGKVDAGEFIQGWFFDKVESLLNDDIGDNNLTSYLGAQLSGYKKTLEDLGITLTIGTIDDLLPVGFPNGLDDPSTDPPVIEHIPPPGRLPGSCGRFTGCGWLPFPPTVPLKDIVFRIGYLPRQKTSGNLWSRRYQTCTKTIDRFLWVRDRLRLQNI